MIQIANALHESGPDPRSPKWDTMFAARNVGPKDLIARFRFRRDDGSVVIWPDGQDHYAATIEVGLMWAASFIPQNGFTAFPIDWQGAGEIDCYNLPLNPFSNAEVSENVLPFVLLAFNDWQTGIQAPTRQFWPTPAQQLNRRLWRFAYAIPNFEDSLGATHTVWATGVLINNQDAIPARGKIIYTVGQNYGALKGKQFEMPFEVKSYGKLRFDLLLGNPAAGLAGLKDVGYPLDLNSEGHLDITTETFVVLQPSLLIVNRPYTFMVSEEAQA